MTAFLVFAVAPCLALAQGGPTVQAAHLTCEYLTDPVGMDVLYPRLGWILEPLDPAAPGLAQSAYQIQVARSEDALRRGDADVWDTGRVESPQSTQVPYGGPRLASHERVFWHVRAWDQDGVASEWSAIARWSMGILSAEEWGAEWIGHAEAYPEPDAPEEAVTLAESQWIWSAGGDPRAEAPQGTRYFRAVLDVPEDATGLRGRAILTADDQFVLWVNGRQVAESGRGGLAWRTPVGAYLTPVLRPGRNVVAAAATNASAGPAGLAGAFRVAWDGGQGATLLTDASWVASDSEQAGWMEPDFDDSSWAAALPVAEMGAEPWGDLTRGTRSDWGQESPSPLLRREFSLDQPVRRATAYVCGLGYHELRLNGRKVGDHVLDPAFTRYDRRALYVAHDVTHLLHEGPNAIGVMLGNGWYNMHEVDEWDFYRAPWRAQPKLLLHLRLEMADGSVRTIVSDGSWRAASGPVVHDCIRNGEDYDARLERPGWDAPGYDDSGWVEPEVVAAPGGVLRAQMAPPIRVTETVKPVSLSEPRPGVWVFDMGQNLAGWARLRVSGPAGAAVTLRYGERVHEDGSLDADAISVFVYQGPFQTDRYVLKGEGVEEWEPRFAYHGFQYVEVEGFPGTPTLDSVVARVVGTDFDRAGDFECSNDLLNWIYRASLWSYRSNFVGYPTDCPHREKNGWTGDAQLACEMGLLNFDAPAAYARWMNDLKDEQRENGELPGIVPTSGWGYGIGPAWDSVYILVPWYLYLYEGDTRVLEEHYDGMKRYVDHLAERFPTRIVDWGLGDWCPARTETNRDLLTTAYACVGARLLSRIADRLGRDADRDRYAALSEEFRAAANERFYEGDGVYAGGTLTAQSCALYMGLADPTETDAVFARLVSAVEASDYHMDVGILGAKYLLNTLSDHGRTDLAYRVVTQEGFPGYATWRERGATTLWEDWQDGWSRNHIMFGDVSAWFVKSLAGIMTDESSPGFRHIVLRPQPAGDLTWVRASHDSPYGTIRSAWTHADGVLRHEVTVPANATATLYLPTSDAARVTEGGRSVAQAPGVSDARTQGACMVMELGSGSYVFEAPLE